MFSLVKFENETYEVVPSKWMDGNNKIFWPDKDVRRCMEHQRLGGRCLSASSMPMVSVTSNQKCPFLFEYFITSFVSAKELFKTFYHGSFVSIL